jgi:hypothetical protein
MYKYRWALESAIAESRGIITLVQYMRDGSSQRQQQRRGVGFMSGAPTKPERSEFARYRNLLALLVQMYSESGG